MEEGENLHVLLNDIERRVEAADRFAVDRQAEREREKYEEMERMLGYVDKKVGGFVTSRRARMGRGEGAMNKHCARAQLWRGQGDPAHGVVRAYL